MDSSLEKEQTSKQSQTENVDSHSLLDATPESTITDSEKRTANGSNDTESARISRTPEQIEEEKKKILAQVEYYFGDKNLPNDRFLNEVRSKNPQGWVPLKMICKFKKMQVYKDYDLIIEALRESPNLLEVDEQGEHVRRKTLVMIDIPQHIKDSPIWRSIYVKGFNKDEIDSNYEKEVASFFSQYGKVEKAFARREDDGTYKDSFFIQFDTHEEAKRVSEMSIVYKNVKLTIMMKFDYCEMKCIEKGLDPNTMRLQKQQPTNREKRSNNNRWTPGCLLHFENAGPKSTYLTIRTQMQNHFGDVKFVQYDQNSLSGVIEFEHPIAHKVIESEELKFDDIKPKLRILKGNEERDYYQKRKNAIYEKTKQSNALKAEFGIVPEENSGNNTNTNVRGKGRAVRGRGHGRKAGKQNAEPDGKEIKTESQDDDATQGNVEKQHESKVKAESQDDDTTQGNAKEQHESGKKRKIESQIESDDDATQRSAEKHEESNDKKRKMESQDKSDDDSAQGKADESDDQKRRIHDELAPGDRSPTKKSRVEAAPEVLSLSSEKKCIDGPRRKSLRNKNRHS